MSFWIIKHRDNDMYYADVPPDRVWTADPMFALRFACEDSALTYMVQSLDGRGQAVEVVAPSGEIPMSCRLR